MGHPPSLTSQSPSSPLSFASFECHFVSAFSAILALWLNCPFAPQVEISSNWIELKLIIEKDLGRLINVNSSF